MESEEYILGLHTMQSRLEQQIAQLEAYKNTLLKETTELKGIKVKGEKVVRQFVDEQVKWSSDRIRESREEMEQELNRHKDKITEINKKVAKLESWEEVVEQGFIELQKKAAALSEKERAVNVKEIGLEEKMQEVCDFVKDTAKEKQSVQKAKELVDKLLDNAKRQLEEFRQVKQEKEELLAQKAKFIHESEKLANARDAVMREGLAYIQEQKLVIADQWHELLKAKKKIDGTS